MNELIAFQINNEAKFSKVYREGVNKCFLMPAEFKDDAMRNFFRVKFEEFLGTAKSCVMTDHDHDNNLFDVRSCSVSESVDFAEEHLERRKIELEYAKERGFVCVEDTEDEAEFPGGNHNTQSNGDSPAKADQFFGVKEEGRTMKCSHFSAEVERAPKHFLYVREVLTDWEVRDNTRE